MVTRVKQDRSLKHRRREPGITPYRRKRQRLYNADVHLIEINLLRRGTRPFAHPRLPAVPYLVTFTRVQAQEVEVCPIALQNALLIMPVPLRPPDADVPLDSAAAVRDIYDEAKLRYLSHFNCQNSDSCPMGRYERFSFRDAP